MFYSDKVAIRAIEEDDLPFLTDLRNFPSTWTNLGTVQFLNLESQKLWLVSLAKDKTRAYYMLIDARSNARLGLIRMDEIDHINKSIRVGCDIHPHWRGQGFGTQAYKLIFNFCYDELNMNRVWLLVLEDNEVARNLYKKVGMHEEGIMREAIYRDGRFKNYIIMSKLRSEDIE